VYSVCSVGTWNDTPIHVIDFEGNRTSGILEFGVVTLRGGELAGTRTRTCAPSGRIAIEDTAVHGLHASGLAGAEPFATEWEYFARLRETGPLAAHFSSAENHLLKSVWPYARQAADFARPGGTTTEWGPWIDTGRLYPQLLPGAAEGKLERLVAIHGLQADLDALAAERVPETRRHYHGALYDALAAALLLLALLRRPDFTDATIPWLLQMSTLDPEKRSDLQQRELF
jgi:DNA polymerase III epsilon subunit-like protein